MRSRRICILSARLRKAMAERGRWPVGGGARAGGGGEFMRCPAAIPNTGRIAGGIYSCFYELMLKRALGVDIRQV